VDKSVIFLTELKAFPMQKKIAETKPTDAAVRVSASCSVIETPNVEITGRGAKNED